MRLLPCIGIMYYLRGEVVRSPRSPLTSSIGIGCVLSAQSTVLADLPWIPFDPAGMLCLPACSLVPDLCFHVPTRCSMSAVTFFFPTWTTFGYDDRCFEFADVALPASSFLLTRHKLVHATASLPVQVHCC